MFFILNQPTAKILPSRAKPNYLDRTPLPKLGDILTRCCQKCHKYGNRRNGFVIYESIYLGNPDTESNKRRLKDFQNIGVCRECYTELCPEPAKFIQ